MDWAEEDLAKPQVLVDLAMARCNMSAIHLPGGSQLNAPDYVTSNQLWTTGMAVERGELSKEDFEQAERVACPTCGACQFMGSASIGQVISEALGLALPGSALVPAPLTQLLRYARATGKQVLKLIEEEITPGRILTREAFENTIVIHAAVGGSTNMLLHLPLIAREAGVEITIDDFDRIHRQVPVLANVKTTGRYPVEYFWYAGGVPAIMLELRDMLHLDCLTVTGKTLGENLVGQLQGIASTEGQWRMIVTIECSSFSSGIGPPVYHLLLTYATTAMRKLSKVRTPFTSCKGQNFA